MTAISWERLRIHTLPDMEHVPLRFWEGRVTEVKHPELKTIFVLPTRDEAARFTAEKILEFVQEKPNAAISWPSSQQGNDVVDYVVKLSKARGISFSEAHFFHLDEYYPIESSHKDSFRKNLREKLFVPLGIPPQHIHEINADPGSDPFVVAREYEKQIDELGIDLALLPIGPDGHIAFDEPGTAGDSPTHPARLSGRTIFRDRIERGLDTPDMAITQGIGTILKAKKILLIDFSPSYNESMKQALFGPISTGNPASLLRNTGTRTEAIMTQEVADHVLSNPL